MLLPLDGVTILHAANNLLAEHRKRGQEMRLWKSAVLGIVAASAIIGSQGTAQADGDGRCDGGDACFYWGANFTGSLRDYSSNRADFGNDRFVAPGAGQTENVKNNSASVKNYDYNLPMQICYNEWYGEPCQTISAAGEANLQSGIANDNASFRWFDW